MTVTELIELLLDVDDGLEVKVLLSEPGLDDTTQAVNEVNVVTDEETGKMIALIS